MERIICLSSTTFIFSTVKEVLFYNSESGSFIKCFKNGHIEEFTRKLSEPDNMYIINEKEIPEDPSLQMLIRDLYSKFMIDYLEYGKTTPIIVPPFLKCHEKLWLEKFPGPLDSIMLMDLYIYINGECKRDCPDCKKTSLQMIHCMRDDGEISIDEIKQVIKEIKSYNQPITVHLCGGDIGQYTSLNGLSVIFEEMKIRPQVHLSYLNWNKALCKQLQSCGPVYIFSVNFPLDSNTISDVIKKCKKDNDKIEFVVTSEDDMIAAEEIIETEKLENADLIPFYDGKNIDFFKKNVLGVEDDILISKPSKQMIYRRMMFNVNNIGKIILRSNGTYWANLNKSQLGCIGQSIASIIEKEWECGESWRDTRQSDSCSKCLYQYLCPSPSNYEYVIKQNLCFRTNRYEK